MREAEHFWRSMLTGFRNPIRFGHREKHESLTQTSERFSRESTSVSMATTSVLQSKARAHQLTLNTLVQGAWALLLQQYSGQSDAVFGATIMGRPTSLEGSESMIGLFINTVPVRVFVSGSTPLFTWLKALQAQQVQARSYEYCPLAKVQSWSDLASGEPLFESLVVFENYPMAMAASDSFVDRRARLQVRQASVIAQTHYPVTLVVLPGKELMLTLGYDSWRLETREAKRILRRLREILERMIDADTQRVEDLLPLNETEKHHVTVEWNDSRRDYEPAKCIHEWIEYQADLQPDRVAVVFEDEHVTYGELNRRANRLAHYLLARGAGLEVRIGSCLERSIAPVLALVAILKTGGTYVPLDSSYPAERLRYMINDAKVRMFVTQSSASGVLPEDDQRIVDLNKDARAIAAHSAENPRARVDLHTAAYVIYTSGSTGRPKGVVTTHRAVVNYLMWLHSQNSSGHTPLPVTAPLGFDVSVRQLMGPLVRGHHVWMLPTEVIAEPSRLIEALSRQGRSGLSGVPTLWSALLDADIHEGQTLKKCLEYLSLGGEPVADELLDRTFAAIPELVVTNAYGPSETTVLATRAGPLAAQKKACIGRPISNAEVYIADDNMQVVTPGFVGEVFVGGAGLARGYLGRPDLTADRFLPDPWSGRSGARVYRTGDLGRYQDDGNLECLGRVDHQVKIRGYRIELGEIEAVLRQQHGVRDVVVTSQSRGREQGLVAYVVADELQELAWLERLRSQLPAYMIPAAFTLIDRLPVGPTGKVDRHALPSVEWSGNRNKEYVAPRNEAERIIAEVWAQVLQVERVGATDNWFALGGDSILSIQVVTKARQRGVEVTPKDVFDHQTIQELARVARRRLSKPTACAIVKGKLPLTPIQKSWLERQPKAPHHFTQSVMLELSGGNQVPHLRSVLEVIVSHHDALSLRYHKNQQGWEQFQEIPDPARTPFTVLDLKDVRTEQQRQVIEESAAAVQRSLNLEKGPIWRAVWMSLEPSSSRLLLVINHLSVDGVSWRILLDDLQAAYEQSLRGEQPRLPTKTSSYRQWAEALLKYAESAPLLQETHYWAKQAKRHMEQLPLDYPEGRNTVGDMATITVGLSNADTMRLLHHSQGVHSAQAEEILLTALVQAFEEWTGKSLLSLTLEGHGRESVIDGPDVSRTVGWFTTLFPVSLEIEPGSGPDEALKGVKEQLRSIPHRGIGYGVLKHLVQSSEAEFLRKTPEPAVSFNYLGQFDQVVNPLSAFKVAQEWRGASQDEHEDRLHLLAVNASIRGQRLRVAWSYSRQQYAKKTIDSIACRHIDLLRALIHGSQSGKVQFATPSDFPMTSLTQEQLDRVIATNPDAVDLYPLSPVQQGLLFHSIYEPSAGMYIEQITCRLDGQVNEQALQEVWELIVDRHAIFRTRVLWEFVGEPLQVVCNRVQLNWIRDDWTGMPRAEQEMELERLLQADRREGFDLSQAPLMRFRFVRLGEQSYQFIWSHHHLLLDGWSVSLVLKEVFTLYEARQQGQELSLPKCRPYREHIAWLQGQDSSGAKSFWRRTLAGFKQPLRIGLSPRSGGASVTSAGREERCLVSRNRSSQDCRLSRANMNLHSTR